LAAEQLADADPAGWRRRNGALLAFFSYHEGIKPEPPGSTFNR
jgi:hypothetical protein